MLNRADAEREREVCARLERETSCLCGRQFQMHNIFICYKQDTQETRSTRDTQMVVIVIDFRLSVLNAHLVYEKHFRGPLPFGGPRQSPIFA